MRKFLLTLLTITTLVVGCQKPTFEADYDLAVERLADLEATEQQLLLQADKDAKVIENLRLLLDELELELENTVLLVESLGVEYNDVTSEILRITELLNEKFENLEALENEITILKDKLTKEEITRTEYIENIQTIEDQIIVARENIRVEVIDVQIDLVRVIERERVEYIYENEVINVTVNDTVDVYVDNVIENIITNVVTEVVDVYAPETVVVTVTEYVDKIVTETVTVVNDILVTTVVTETINVVETVTVTDTQYNDYSEDMKALEDEILRLQGIIDAFDSSNDESSKLDELAAFDNNEYLVSLDWNRDARFLRNGTNRKTTVYNFSVSDRDGNTESGYMYAIGYGSYAGGSYGAVIQNPTSLDEIKPQYGGGFSSGWTTFTEYFTAERTGETWTPAHISIQNVRRQGWENRVGRLLKSSDVAGVTNTDYGYEFNHETNVLSIYTDVDHAFSIKVNGGNWYGDDGNYVVTTGGTVWVTVSSGAYRGQFKLDTTESSSGKTKFAYVN